MEYNNDSQAFPNSYKIALTPVKAARSIELKSLPRHDPVLSEYRIVYFMQIVLFDNESTRRGRITD